MKKYKQTLDEVFGDRTDDMVYIRIICTNPAKQGRGYASALVREVTKIVRTSSHPHSYLLIHMF